MPDETELTAFWVAATPDRMLPGAGVTAYSMEDADRLLDDAQVDVVNENAEWWVGVTVEDLDQNEVVPNIGAIDRRGVWYPNLNSSA